MGNNCPLINAGSAFNWNSLFSSSCEPSPYIYIYISSIFLTTFNLFSLSHPRFKFYKLNPKSPYLILILILQHLDELITQQNIYIYIYMFELKICFNLAFIFPLSSLLWVPTIFFVLFFSLSLINVLLQESIFFFHLSPFILSRSLPQRVIVHEVKPPDVFLTFIPPRKFRSRITR